MDVKKKYEIEAALATEARAISSGQLKEENPLDLSDDFRVFCEACRRGDLKVCQEMISTGVNINARDKFDYTPLILVRRHYVPRSCEWDALTAQGQSVWSLRSHTLAA
jgi:ankyrin repeat/BTB/POZ domain-containing protein 1